MPNNISKIRIQPDLNIPLNDATYNIANGNIISALSNVFEPDMKSIDDDKYGSTPLLFWFMHRKMNIMDEREKEAIILHKAWNVPNRKILNMFQTSDIFSSLDDDFCDNVLEHQMISCIFMSTLFAEYQMIINPNYNDNVDFYNKFNADLTKNKFFTMCHFISLGMDMHISFCKYGKKTYTHNCGHVKYILPLCKQLYGTHKYWTLIGENEPQYTIENFLIEHNQLSL